MQKEYNLGEWLKLNTIQKTRYIRNNSVNLESATNLELLEIAKYIVNQSKYLYFKPDIIKMINYCIEKLGDDVVDIFFDDMDITCHELNIDIYNVLPNLSIYSVIKILDSQSQYDIIKNYKNVLAYYKIHHPDNFQEQLYLLLRTRTDIINIINFMSEHENLKTDESIFLCIHERVKIDHFYELFKLMPVNLMNIKQLEILSDNMKKYYNNIDKNDNFIKIIEKYYENNIKLSNTKNFITDILNLSSAYNILQLYEKYEDITSTFKKYLYDILEFVPYEKKKKFTHKAFFNNLKIDEEICELLCKSNFIDIIEYIIGENKFIANDKCMDYAVDNLNDQIINELINMKIRLTDCHLKKILSKDKRYLNEKTINTIFNYMAFCNVDITYDDLEILLEKNIIIDKIEQYKLNYGEELYYACYCFAGSCKKIIGPKDQSYMTLASKYINLCNSKLTIFRNSFSTDRLEKLKNIIERSGFVPDQYCYDYSHDNKDWERILKWLTEEYKFKPTILTVTRLNNVRSTTEYKEVKIKKQRIMRENYFNNGVVCTDYKSLYFIKREKK